MICKKCLEKISGETKVIEGYSLIKLSCAKVNSVWLDSDMKIVNYKPKFSLWLQVLKKFKNGKEKKQEHEITYMSKFCPNCGVDLKEEV